MSTSESISSHGARHSYWLCLEHESYPGVGVRSASPEQLYGLKVGEKELPTGVLYNSRDPVHIEHHVSGVPKSMHVMRCQSRKTQCEQCSLELGNG